MQSPLAFATLSADADDADDGAWVNPAAMLSIVRTRPAGSALPLPLSRGSGVVRFKPRPLASVATSSSLSIDLV